MIKALMIPQEPFFLACSGGEDSMAVLHFLMQSHRHHLSVLHINHGTPHASLAQQCVETFCSLQRIPHQTHHLDPTLPKGQSKEAIWRARRYDVFHQAGRPVVTAHHLDDCMETWVFTSLHGEGKIIPFRNKNVIRPFLLTRKKDLASYVVRKNIPHTLDPSNTDIRFARNNIRHQLMPLCIEINQGLHTTVGKKVKQMLINERQLMDEANNSVGIQQVRSFP